MVQVWPVVHGYLVDNNIQSVKVSDIPGMMQKGYTLLDVRLEKDFNQGHAKGAINVPLFRPVSRDDTWSQIKKVVSALMVMTPTGHPLQQASLSFPCDAERNTNFVEDVTAAVPKKSKILVMCSRGGTLDTIIVGPGDNPKTCKDPDRAFGRETRSLKAIFELLQVGVLRLNGHTFAYLFQGGFTDLFYVEGGIGQWVYDGMDVISS